ncbi:MAG: hypothetical protein R3B89_10520 [Polyangiaceae bacterium]
MKLALPEVGTRLAALALLGLEACLPRAPETPAPPRLPRIPQQLSAGLRDTCVVTEAGEVYCWGENCHGAPRDGYFEFVCSRPRRVPGLSHVKAFAPMQSHAGVDCALMHDGSVSCAKLHEPYRDVLAGGAMDIYHGETFVCALLNDGHVSCWGTLVGVVEAPELAGAEAPTVLQGPHDVESISATTGRACALSKTGEAWCWTAKHRTTDLVPTVERPPLRLVALGLQHGYIDMGWSRLPWDISAPRSVSEGGNTCLLERSGLIRCSGSVRHREDAGDFGNTPQAFTAIAIGLEHACALDAGVARCWGANGVAQLGREGNRSSSPTPVHTAEPLVDIVAGYNHTCARSASGAVWCWGANAQGELGLGSRTRYEIGAQRVRAFDAQPTGTGDLAIP